MKLNIDTMSKNILPLALGIILSGAGVFAAVKPIESYRLLPAEPVIFPARPSAQDSALNKFDRNLLLKQRRTIGILENSADMVTINADSTGVVTLPAAKTNGYVQTMVTRLRSPRYFKGKIVMKSNVPASLMVDGVSILSHTTADTVAIAETSPIEIQPEKTLQVQIDYLAMPEYPNAPEISLALENNSDSDLLPLAGADVERRFQIETTTLGNRVSGVSVSPDGNYLIINYSNTTDGKNYTSETEIVSTSDYKSIFATTENVNWMPKGAILYQTRKAADGNGYELIKRKPDGGTAGTPIRVSADRFTISPDESFIIYYDEVKGKKEEGPMIRIKEPDDRMPGVRDAYYLVKQDLKTGTTMRLTYGGPSTMLEDISPDSKRILYTTTRRTPSEFPFYASCLVQMDLATLATDTIAAGTGEGAFATAHYSPDGKKLFITAGPEAFNGIGRNAGEFQYANEYDVQGFIYDLSTNEVKAVTRDFRPSIKGNPVWNKADGKIYFQAEEGFYSPVYCFDPAKDTFAKLNTEIEYSRGFSIGEYESKWLATTGTSYHYAGRATLLNLKNGKASIVADPFGPAMEGIALGIEEPWSFKAENGSVIDGMMVLPPDFDPSKKYPLIVYYYGGTSPSSRQMTNPYTPHLFASRNYVVYVLNPSGTPGYGQEFSARHVNAWGDWTADEIIEGVKEFCKQHRYVDDKKIGCLGASYGGFMTQYLLTKTDIFAAAVSHAGISNVTSYWGEGWWGYSYNSVAAARSYPWSNPDLFTKHGSLFNADKIHTPLLLLHGNADTNVPVGESIQLFNALQILGREVELIEVDGENHFIADYEKRKLWHATIMAWFARWLQDDPTWWNSMYGD